MSEFSIRYFLTSDDPLSEEAFKFLIKYREEDDLLDFKEAFDPDSEKEWLEVTKDVMAFANTKGGYIVFGVRDGTFELVGVDENTAKVLTNTNNFLQKINRFLDPHINLLRSKELVCDGKRVVAIWIPESIGKTHLVLKDAEFEFPSGRKKNILNRGTFYIRRSGGNQLADARVVEDIVEKRLNLLKETLLSKIARVVEAPPESEIFVLSQDPTGEPHKRFIIDDAPEAIPVKGMSFTISPVTGEQEVAAWTAMWAGDSAAIPPSRTLWRWYAERDNLKLSEKLRLQLAEFCLLSDVPTFYWLRGCSSESIKGILLDAISRKTNRTNVEVIVGIAAFLGKHFHRKIFSRSKGRSKRLSPRVPNIPMGGPQCLFAKEIIEVKRDLRFRKSESIFREHLLTRLNEIATSVTEINVEQPGVLDRREAHEIDCYLYAQSDKYARKTAENKFDEQSEQD